MSDPSGSTPEHHGKPRGARSPLRFAPLALLLVIAMLALARWQWTRAEEKRELRHAALTHRALPALALSGAVPETLPRYRHIRLKGRWQGEPLFLENQIQQGRAGYQVLMAFQPDGEERLFVVWRGWMPKRFDRPPQWTPATAPAELEFEVGRWPPAGPLLKQGQTVQGLDRKSLGQVWGRPVHELPLLEISAANDGLQRQWPAPGEEEIAKHLSYAGQWLLFSVMVLGAYCFYVASYWRRRQS